VAGRANDLAQNLRTLAGRYPLLASPLLLVLGVALEAQTGSRKLLAGVTAVLLVGVTLNWLFWRFGSRPARAVERDRTSTR
jgi:hypothetical protein